jgi:nicotinamide-nucleotide amidase
MVRTGWTFTSTFHHEHSGINSDQRGVTLPRYPILISLIHAPEVRGLFKPRAKPGESAAARGEAAMKDEDDALMRLAAGVGKNLLKRGQVVTTAESCTGGWIAKALTDVPGSSQWFGEGFVTYSNDAKVHSLGVSRAALAREGAVSAAVARAMAQGALRRTGAELAVAVTGIAGPDGAVPGKPVGTVWFCWAQRVAGRTRSFVEHKRFRGGRDAVRRSTVRHALRRLALAEVFR